MKYSVSVLIVAMGLLCTSHSAYAIEFRVEILGQLGGDIACARSINNSGQITGYVYGTSGSRAFVLDTTGDLRLLPRLTAYAEGTAINASGTVVGYATNDIGRWHACAWDASGNLSDLDTANGSWATDINDSGVVAGYQEYSGFTHASYWNTDNAVTDLHFSEYLGRPVSSTVAHGINGVGQVAGNCGWVSGGHATVWDPLGDFRVLESSLYGDSDALSINDSGVVAGYINGHPCVWDADGNIQVLETAEGHFNCINNLGQAVGFGSASAANQSWGACYWDSANGLQMLPTPAGTLSSVAYGLHSMGWIVGTADRNIMLWKPVPEPSSLLALLCGVGGVCGTFVRRRG